MDFMLIMLILLAAVSVYLAIKASYVAVKLRKSSAGLMNEFNQTRKKERLVVSEMDIFKKALIALDRRMTKLVLVSNEADQCSTRYIPMRDLMFCRVVKTTGNNGEVRMIALELHLQNRDLINIVFFDEEVDRLPELPRRLKKAESWKKKLQYQLSVMNAEPAGQ
ncbi:MAG: hypothetical protein EOO04_35975 [Chitinophagaceae bacterium]|nr:MAG: hypothetical protein EOO04_35975 [Chitinophagaceae bacterium]